MNLFTPRHLLGTGVLAATCLASSSCRIHSYSEPPRIVGEGIVRGHAAVGIHDEDEVLHLHFFGRNGIVDLTIWRLLRLEIGIAGASVGVGPIDLGLGALFYDPYVPDMLHDDDEDDDGHWDEDHDEAHEHDGGDDDGGRDDAPAPKAASGADRWK